MNPDLGISPYYLVTDHPQYRYKSDHRQTYLYRMIRNKEMLLPPHINRVITLQIILSLQITLPKPLKPRPMLKINLIISLPKIISIFLPFLGLKREFPINNLTFKESSQGRKFGSQAFNK